MAEITPKLLERAFKKACSSFAPDELAYLALTSKPEHPIRDRLAWLLHTELPGHIAAREWSRNGAQGRTDLAVLDEATHEPLALLEMKAAYTFDFARKEQATVEKYSRYMADDLAKAATVSAGRARVYGLLLLTHPTSAPNQPTSVVKYGLDISRSLAQLRADDLSCAARENARLILQVHGEVNYRSGTPHWVVTIDTYLLTDAPALSSAGEPRGVVDQTHLPSARTASSAVFHATPTLSATRVLDHKPLQGPPQPATRQLRSRLGGLAGVAGTTCPQPLHR